MSVAPQIVTVHTKPDCPYCTRAKVLLDRVGIPYDTIPHAGQAERNAVYDAHALPPERRTMPVILIDGDYRGGYHDLVQLVATGAVR